MKAGTREEGASPESWERMLKAVLVRNAAAQVDAPGSDGSLTVKVPSRKPAWAVPPITWVVRPPERRTLQLDPLGAEVWNACAERRTAEEVIDFFARKHSLTFHESRVSVTAYIKTLVQRGALAVVMS